MGAEQIRKWTDAKPPYSGDDSDSVYGNHVNDYIDDEDIYDYTYFDPYGPLPALGRDSARKPAPPAPPGGEEPIYGNCPSLSSSDDQESVYSDHYHLRHKSTTDAVHPPKYWTFQGDMHQVCRGFKTTVNPLTPNCTIYVEIENMIYDTWKSDLVGKGFDATGLEHREITVLNISCVENPFYLRRYLNEKYEFLHELNRTRTTIKELDEKPAIAKFNELFKDRMNAEINEYYLFHGTTPDNKNGIISTELDQRLCSNSSLFGSGIYFSDSSTKADQYADNRRKSNNPSPGATASPEKCYMFVCRVLLGNAYVCMTPRQFKRPPCQNACLTDTCSNPDHMPCYDSVVGTHNYADVDKTKFRKLLFPEYIVYDGRRCYPEFLVEYTREYDLAS